MYLTIAREQSDSILRAPSGTPLRTLLGLTSSSNSLRPAFCDPGGIPDGTLALEAAQLLRLSLGVDKRAIAIAAMGLLLGLAIGPNATAIRPFVYLLLAVTAVYFIVRECYAAA